MTFSPRARKQLSSLLYLLFVTLGVLYLALTDPEPPQMNADATPAQGPSVG